MNLNLKDLLGKTISDVKVSGQRINENGSPCQYTFYWLEIIFQDGTYLSIEPSTAEFVDILLDRIEEDLHPCG